MEAVGLSMEYVGLLRNMLEYRWNLLEYEWNMLEHRWPVVEWNTRNSVENLKHYFWTPFALITLPTNLTFSAAKL